MRLLLFILTAGLLTACTSGVDTQTSAIDPANNKPIVTVNWDYNPETSAEIQQLRLYYAGGSLICTTDDPATLEMNCELDAVDTLSSFKLTAFNRDGSESRYPASFCVN
ncbi:hypothetical protein ACFL6N_02995 [Thermodesulfobacteriota bacterium]